MIAEALEPFETIEAWPSGKLLFREGAPPNGVYYVHSGEVEICFGSRSFMIAEEGQILGLASILGGRPHDCSATARSACITGFIPKERFLLLLEDKPVLWLAVLRMISANINACWECMRRLSSGARNRLVTAENVNAQA